VVLHADEPGMVGELGDFGEILGLRLRADVEPRGLEAAHVVVVHLVPVAEPAAVVVQLGWTERFV